MYNAIARTGTGAAASVTGVGFAPDLTFGCQRTGQYTRWHDRLRGSVAALNSGVANAETSVAESVKSLDSDGFTLGTDGYFNANAVAQINWFFRRAPGVFDIVCYTGNGTNQALTHNLEVVPELIIIKNRTEAQDWIVYAGDPTRSMSLSASYNGNILNVNAWNTTYPTSSAFTVGPDYSQNHVAAQYVAYLFATKAGISKVGSYTGNGGNQTIACGFTFGARFILIGRTDTSAITTWFVWDTLRGISASANDPHLSINGSSAEATSDDSIDPDNSGFKVKQNTTTYINVNGGKYIFLAIA
ncbi:MAG: DUF7483 domain-containing protein [Pseudobdellovibrionaceae bacterium]